MKLIYIRILVYDCITIHNISVGTVQLSKEVLTWAELESKFLTLQSGGRYKPVNCTSRHRVAIIIPCRERDIQLKILLNNLHPVLQRQQLDYGIFVVDLVHILKYRMLLFVHALSSRVFVGLGPRI